MVKAEYLVGAAVLLSALLVSIVIYFGTSGISQGVAKLDRGLASSLAAAGVAGGSGSAGSALPELEKEVTIDFLYADWCPHCQNMKPIVQKIESLLPSDRFAVRYWSEADAQSGGKAKEVFAEYSRKGMFPGYPTFVMNNGKNRTSGEMSQAEMLRWICSEFGSPKPSACQ